MDAAVLIRRVRARRAISRRTGSKDDSMTASGVSSMIRSTPVACSRARMLRPSRPMIRPFMSSLGIGTTETVVSETASVAMRWIVAVRISRARGPAFSFDLFLDLAHEAVGVLADLRLDLGHEHVRASPWVRWATRSSSAMRWPVQLFDSLARFLELLLALGEACCRGGRSPPAYGRGSLRAGRRAARGVRTSWRALWPRFRPERGSGSPPL